MQQPDEALYSLLCKYLLNEADGLERRWVDTWRKENAANEEALSAVRRLLEGPAPAVQYPGPDTASSWERLKGRILQGAPSATQQNAASAPPQSETPPRLRRYRWLQIAAALVLLAGLATWFTLHTRTSPVIFTGAQQAVLEDGSSVTMEQGAKLQLDDNFGDKERRVTFSGKAEFDIKQNAGAPFVILLGETTVKVLGTRFTVDFQPGNHALTVHVSNGRVQVNGRGNKSIILSQGMLLKRSEPQQPFEVAAHVQDIRRRSLVFRNVPLGEALQTLRAVYGISVNVEDSALLRTEITTNFENESIENIMETIAFMTNTKVEKTGEQRFSIR